MRRAFGVLLVAGRHTHQEMYAAAFAADPRCRLVAVSDEVDVDPRRKALNEALARDYKIPYIADLNDALAREDVHIVSVCAEPARRGPIIVRCARAGKHLYLDKSLAPRSADIEAILPAVRRAGVRSHMFTFITTDWARRAKAWLASGALGELRAVHGDCFFAKGHPGRAELGQPRREESPPARHQGIDAKREFDNCGIYPITMIPWLTGKRFQRVRALTGNYFFSEHQQANVEDFGLLNGTLEGDIPVTVSAGRYGWTSHPAAGVNRVVLVGTERIIVVDANRPRLEVFNDATPWTPPRPHPDDPMFFWNTTQTEMNVRPKTMWLPIGANVGSDAKYFIDCVEAERESEMSVRQAGHAAEVLLATYRSAAEQKEITLS